LYLAAQLDPTGSRGLQSKKFDRDWRPKKPKNRCERNALPWAGEITQPSQQRFTLHMRAREGSRSIFLLRTRAGYRGPADTGKHPRLGPPGASMFPRIWNRSIDPCEKGVKRKTRHVVDFFVPCLFVVVALQAQLFCFVSPRESSRGKLFVEMSEEKFRSDRTSHACKFKVASRFPEMIFSHSTQTLSKRCARQRL